MPCKGKIRFVKYVLRITFKSQNLPIDDAGSIRLADTRTRPPTNER